MNSVERKIRLITLIGGSIIILLPRRVREGKEQIGGKPNTFFRNWYLLFYSLTKIWSNFHDNLFIDSILLRLVLFFVSFYEQYLSMKIVIDNISKYS